MSKFWANKLFWACIFFLVIAMQGVLSADYTPPSQSSVNLTLAGAYTPPSQAEVNLTLNEEAVAVNVSLNLTFGPDGITSFKWLGCGPQITNTSTVPNGQNTTRGIDYLCNNGTTTGTVSIFLSGTPAANWTIFASATNITGGLINLSLNPTTAKDIITDLTAGSCAYVWFVGTCDRVSSNPQVYEIYNITGS